MFSSAANDTTPLTSPVRAAVKRVSRKDDDVALASDIQFETSLKIVEYPDPILRAKKKRIGVFDENLKNLVDAMFDVMYKTDGIGLSALQVGFNVQLMVFNPAEEPAEGEDFVLVNPKTNKYSDKLVPFDEGCLSFPGIYAEVVVYPPFIHWITFSPNLYLISSLYHILSLFFLGNRFSYDWFCFQRPQSVKIDARDITGARFSINLSRLPARIFQHEYGHLEVLSPLDFDIFA